MVEARAGVDPAANRLQRLQPAPDTEDRFAELVEHIEELTFQLRLLADAHEQEAEVTANQLAVAQEALTAIDEAAAAVDVPNCSSGSWARAYVEASTAYIATQLPMPTPGTGDFVTDASAACGRFYGTFAFSPAGTEIPADPAEYAAFLQTLEDAYDQFAVDLRALTPPSGSERDFAEVIERIALSGKAVDRADRDPRRFAELERALGAIGSDLGTLARILGFTC